LLAACDSEPAAPPPPDTNALATAAGDALLPASGPKCTEAFAGPASVESPAPGSLTGPAVGLMQRDVHLLEERFWEFQPTALSEWKNNDLKYHLSIVPYRVLPASKDSVQTLVCVRDTLYLIGHYENGTPGVRHEWAVRVLRWPSGELLGGRVFQGSDPPATAEVEGYCNATTNRCSVKGGGKPDTAVLDWLDGLFAR
jgi:hypothetical protein